MKINKFLIGFGLGDLIATYICEWLYKKSLIQEYDISSKVIKLQSEVIHTFYDELTDAYDKIKKLERAEIYGDGKK